MGKIYSGFLKHSTVNEDPATTAATLWALPLIFTKNRAAIFLLQLRTDSILQG
jgi:hypothetical protein